MPVSMTYATPTQLPRSAPGDDIKTVQGNLGHATAAFTLDVYGHVTKQMKRESADRMERFIRTVSAG